MENGTLSRIKYERAVLIIANKKTGSWQLELSDAYFAAAVLHSESQMRHINQDVKLTWAAGFLSHYERFKQEQEFNSALGLDFVFELNDGHVEGLERLDFSEVVLAHEDHKVTIHA